MRKREGFSAPSVHDEHAQSRPVKQVRPRHRRRPAEVPIGFGLAARGLGEDGSERERSGPRLGGHNLYCEDVGVSEHGGGLRRRAGGRAGRRRVGVCVSGEHT